MTPSFVEELFMRIEERLNKLDNEMHEMRVEISTFKDEISKCASCRADMEKVKRYVWVGRGVVFAVWGFIVTCINILIGKWINAE